MTKLKQKSLKAEGIQYNGKNGNELLKMFPGRVVSTFANQVLTGNEELLILPMQPELPILKIQVGWWVIVDNRGVLSGFPDVYVKATYDVEIPNETEEPKLEPDPKETVN